MKAAGHFDEAGLVGVKGGECLLTSREVMSPKEAGHSQQQACEYNEQEDMGCFGWSGHFDRLYTRNEWANRPTKIPS